MMKLEVVSGTKQKPRVHWFTNDFTVVLRVFKWHFYLMSVDANGIPLSRTKWFPDGFLRQQSWFGYWRKPIKAAS